MPIHWETCGITNQGFVYNECNSDKLSTLEIVGLITLVPASIIREMLNKYPEIDDDKWEEIKTSLNKIVEIEFNI